MDDTNKDLIEVVHDPEVEKLLTRYTDSRESLEGDLKSVHDLKDKLEAMFPNDLNHRNKHVLEEKIKIVSSFFSTILNFRQEINKSIVNEIDVRRKLLPSKDNKHKPSNIRKMAEEIEKLMKTDVDTKKRRSTDDR